MVHQTSAQANDSDPATSGGTMLPAIMRQGVRAVWVLLLLGSAWLVVAGSPTLFAFYRQVCPGQLCFPLPQLNAESAQLISHIVGTLDSYAVIMVGLEWVLVICWWVVGALLMWYRPLDPVALIVALISVSLSSSFFAVVLGRESPLYGPALQLLAFLNGGAVIVWFCALFPDGRWVPRWSSVVTLIATVYYAMYALIIVPAPADSWRGLLDGLLNIAALAYGLAIQIYRYRRVSDMTQRRQALWLLFGIGVLLLNYAAGTALVALGRVGPWLMPIIAMRFVGELLLPIAFGVAVLRYRLFAIEIILNRALVYGGLTAFVIGIYASVVGTLGALIQSRGSFLASLVAAGVVAILFQPLRERLQRGANRLLYGQRGEPDAVVAQLGKQLASTQTPDDMLHAIAQTIGRTLKLPYVKLATLGERRWEAEYHEPSFNPRAYAADRHVTFPLSYQGEQLGVLQVASRTGERLDRADHSLLQDLAGQAGIAVHAAQATADLQRSRERIVTAREEERRRIRRDLHDGLGPQLASHSLKLETARDLIPDQPARAEAILNDLIALSQKLVGDIRQLVYALRPPALDDFGLIGALREVISRVAPPTLHVEIRAPDAVPALPAAVEVAAYRIAQEAITNVARHAQATHCVVYVALASRHNHDDTFLLEVRDDGIGVAADTRSGVGMHSMRERAEELGGALTIAANQPCGTIVQVSLPIITL